MRIERIRDWLRMIQMDLSMIQKNIREKKNVPFMKSQLNAIVQSLGAMSIHEQFKYEVDLQSRLKARAEKILSKKSLKEEV